MHMLIRVILFLVGLFFLIFGMNLLWGGGFAQALWIWPNALWVSTYLMGSTLIALSIVALWLALSDNFRAMMGASIGSMVSFGGMGIYFLMEGQQLYGRPCLYLAIISTWAFYVSWHAKGQTRDRLPHHALWLFGILASLSLLEGLYLITGVPQNFAWPMVADLAVSYGWMLISAAFFFAWAVLYPTWDSGYPALYALFAYDLLLVGPTMSLLGGASFSVNSFYLWAMVITILGSGIWSFYLLGTRLLLIRSRS